MKSFPLLLFITLSILSVPSSAPLAQGQADKVKAVFLFKFFDYVTWPPGKIPGENGDGVLCTYGRHSFGETLDYIAARKSGKYRLRTRAVSAPDDIKGCHVLYIARSNYKKISGVARSRGTLIVGDSDGVLERGGAIELQENDGKVGLVIDLQNAKKQNLKISSRLLDVADVKR